MKLLIFVFSMGSMLFLSSCSLFQREGNFKEDRNISPVNKTVNEKNVPQKVSQEDFLDSLPRLVDIPIGHAKQVSLEIPSSLFYQVKDDLGEMRCDGKTVQYHTKANKLYAFLSVGYKVPKNYTCSLSVDGNFFDLFKVRFTSYNYRVETLNVAKKHVDLSPEAVKRWRKEMKKQKEVYGYSSPIPYFDGPFKAPLNSFITSHYGVKRVFNNKKDSWHSGTDFRGAIGTPIPVANRGKVVFTGDLFFNGLAVIVDHGLGIHTMYCHMSEISAKEGEIVPKGTIIGKVGATGRVSGPHLHWGVKINGNWIRGLDLVDKEVFQ